MICSSPLARKLGAYVALSEAEFAVLEGFQQRRRTFEPGKDIIYQGQLVRSVYILAEGWVCSYKLLPGGERQIVDFQIPGDFLGLRSVLFRVSDHNIEPVTRVEALEILASDLLEAFDKMPRLANAILWAASRDEAMVVEHLVDLGRRSAVERTAHFLLELGARLQLVGLGSRTSYACPLSQPMLADALGLTAIHLNRILRQLREERLLTFRKGRVTFEDLDGLILLSGFDKAYLDQEGPLLR